MIDRRVDVAGAVTLTAGMLLLVLGVVRAPDVAWQLTAATVGASAGAARRVRR